jgi:hypothetical protein
MHKPFLKALKLQDSAAFNKRLTIGTKIAFILGVMGFGR